MNMVTPPGLSVRQPLELATTQIVALQVILDELRVGAVRRLQRGDVDQGGEHDPDDFDQALERFSVDSAREEIDEIDAALERLSVEAFGTCEHCAGPIPYERLVALPLTRFCVNCAQADVMPVQRSGA